MMGPDVTSICANGKKPDQCQEDKQEPSSLGTRQVSPNQWHGDKQETEI